MKKALIFILAISLIAGMAYAFTFSKKSDFRPEAVDQAKGDATKPITIVFVGDIMLDRAVAKHAKSYGYDSLFSKVGDLLAAGQINIGNLEGTITDNKSLSQTNNSILKFTFDPAVTELLRKNNFTALSLANNHALDFGYAGYEKTLNYLNDAGIVAFGSPNNNRNLSARINEQGKSICLVGYHDLYVPNSEPAVSQIKKDRSSCSYVIVVVHWGEEYQSKPNARQRQLAHEFIETGADLVIGHHPHVVQPIEVYKNRAIFYSLGNFVFDQGLSFATEHGLAVRLELTDTSETFTLIPTALRDREVEFANETESARIMSAIIDNDLLLGRFSSDILERKSFSLTR